MKKALIWILVPCFLLVGFCSCSRTPESDDIIPGGVTDVQPDQYTYIFSSYQNLVQALTEKGSTGYSMLRENQDQYGTAFQNTLNKFANGDIKIAIPQMDESAMHLRNENGYSNITFFTRELYDLPWFWYHCTVDNQKLDVRISYFDAISPVEGSQNATYVQLLKSIAPDAPSPDNYQTYESYKKISEQTIVLKDEGAVTAMISELKDRPNLYVMFYHNGMLVILDGDPALFSDQFWKSFGFGYR